MSIITTFPAVPSRLFSLYAALADSEDGELRQQLEAWATPPSLATRGGGDEDEGSSTLFTSALQEARKLGIVEESDDRLKITVEARGVRKNSADLETEFRTYISEVLFDRTRAGKAEQSAFMLAIAWLLSKNPFQSLNFSEAPQEMLKADLGMNRGQNRADQPILLPQLSLLGALLRLCDVRWLWLRASSLSRSSTGDRGRTAAHFWR